MRHILQASQVNQNGVAAKPRAHENQRRLDPVRVCQPADGLQTDEAQKLVQYAELPVEDPQPDDGGRDHRRDGRHIENAAVQGQAAYLGIQQQRHQHVEDQMNRQANHDHVERIGYADFEDAVFQQEPVVVQADIARRLQYVVAREAVLQRLHDGTDIKEEEADNGGRNEEQANQQRTALPLAKAESSWQSEIGHVRALVARLFATETQRHRELAGRRGVSLRRPNVCRVRVANGRPNGSPLQDSRKRTKGGLHHRHVQFALDFLGDAVERRLRR